MKLTRWIPAAAIAALLFHAPNVFAQHAVAQPAKNETTEDTHIRAYVELLRSDHCGAIGGNAGKGAAIGAVAGVGLSAATKGQPIRVPSETLLEFSLAQPTRLPVAR